MFENKTFEDILGSMLETVTNEFPDLDTRVGSVIYTALAPVALELETVYREMDMILQETFLDSASKEYLIKHGNQLGLEINEATYGHFIGEFDVDVEIGSRFNLDEYNYTVTAKIAEPTDSQPYYTCELVCETAGSEPNSVFGDLSPITFVAGLSHAKLTAVTIYGEDEEETEVFRYRLQTHVKTPPVSGNVSQYNEWLSEYAGIGKYRTIPCWNGQNTVKLLILNSENQSASDELVSDVQEYFDPNSEGMGNGKAPIGAIVTVATASEVAVKVNCKLVLKDGYASPVGVEDAVKNYLSTVALTDKPVAYMPISAAIYNSGSVAEISNLTVTVGNTVMDIEATTFISSVSLSNDTIPVLDVENSSWGV